MSWIDIINKKDFCWSVNTRNLKEITPYELHRCIFPTNRDAYIEYLDYVTKILGIEKNNSICEFGCGNGANLLYFNQKYNSPVSGVDISVHLVEFCNELFGSGFYVNSGLPFPSKSVDYVISNSVFQYLENYDISTHIITDMCKIARKGVLITDLKDISTINEFKMKQAERQSISIEELYLKYKDTPHLFFDRNNFDITFDMPNSYPDSEFKSFSVYIDLM